MPEAARPGAGVADGSVAAVAGGRVDAPRLAAAVAPAAVVAVAVAGGRAGVLALVAVAGGSAGALVPAAVGAVAGLAVAHFPDGHGGLFPLEHAVQPHAA